MLLFEVFSYIFVLFNDLAQLVVFFGLVVIFELLPVRHELVGV